MPPTVRGSGSRLFVRGDLVVVGLVLLYVVMMLPGLTRFPPINNDEGREANLSWAAAGLQPGAERMNLYRGFATWGTGGLQGATTVVIFRLSDLANIDTSLVFQARLTSLLWGGLLLLVVYWLGSWYWSRAVGLAAAVLLAVSNPFLLSTHTLRPDVQIITLALTSLALVEYGIATGRGSPQVLAGLLLALSFDTHMNTLVLAGMVAAAPLVRFGRGALARPTVWLLAAGLGLGAIYYAAVRIIPDPAGYLAGLRYWVGIDKAPPLVSQGGPAGFGAQLGLEISRYADYFGISERAIEEPAELALVLLALCLAVWRAARGSRVDQVLLIGLLAAQVVFVLAVSMKSRYYMLLTYPAYALFIARAFQQVVGQIRNTSFQRTTLAALVLLTVVWPLKLEDRAWDNYVRASRYRAGQEYYALTGELDRLAGPGAKIMAPPLYWFGLHNHQFVDIFVHERVRRQYGETPSEFLEGVRPDIVITDAKIGTDKASEREMYRALDQKAPYELIVRHKNYGDVAIYRPSWR